MGAHEQDLQEAVAAVFSNDLRRRLVLLLLDNPGGVRYAEARRAIAASGNDQFQRAFKDLMAHGVIDRRLEPEGEQFASVLHLSPRGLRIARGLREHATLKIRDEVIGAAIAHEVSGHYTRTVLVH